MEAEKTNYDRISQSVSSIKEHELALKWINEYGFESADKHHIRVVITQEVASACVGAKEAARVLAAYSRLAMPEIVKTAAQSCRNTIEIEREAIAAELAKS